MITSNNERAAIGSSLLQNILCHETFYLNLLKGCGNVNNAKSEDSYKKTTQFLTMCTKVWYNPCF